MSSDEQIERGARRIHILNRLQLSRESIDAVHAHVENVNGWANRETWTFMLNISNDEGMYSATRELVESVYDHTLTDYDLGGEVVSHWRDMDAPDLNREIGSWWRLNYEEIGASLREMFNLTDQTDRPTCTECDDDDDDDDDLTHGLCGSCYHDAIRSGWDPTSEGNES